MNYARAAWNWGQVGTRAVFYGSIALTVGLGSRHRPLLHWCMRRWCAGSSDGLKIDRALHGGAHIDATPQAIIVANHQSALDILVIGGFLKRDFRWLAKADLFKVPFSGWYLGLAGHIKVHRGEAAAERNRLIKEQIHAVVQEGASVLFFPEGTRPRDGRMKPFRLGAFLAAVREDLPVLPLVVRGTGELMEAGANDLSVKPDRACSVTALPAIHPADFPGDDPVERAIALRDHIYRIYCAELGPENIAAPPDAADAEAARVLERAEHG